jgi:ubiquinone/menaquinone biosynthesis C-methylase UbiE
LRQEETKEWYDFYYKKKGNDRNDLVTNRGVLFQFLATEASFIKAMYSVPLDRETSRVLDVGCGSGSDIPFLLRENMDPSHIFGIDIQEVRLGKARCTYPKCNFLLLDASKTDFPDDYFDLVTEFTMFATLAEEENCKNIAKEMIRVCRVGGYIVLTDVKMRKPWDQNYNALTRRKLRGHFGVGKETELITVVSGALLPPVGRYLSSSMPWLYFLIAAVFPFLVGQVVYVLRKLEP